MKFSSPKYILIGYEGFIGGELNSQIINKMGLVLVGFEKDTRLEYIHFTEKNFTYFKDINGIFILGGASSAPMYFNEKCGDSYHLTLEPMISATRLSSKIKRPIIYATTSHTQHATTGYTCAMLARQNLAKGFSTETGVPTLGLSFYSVYGSSEWRKQQYANVISQMIWCALFKKPFKIFGDGKQTRDFIHVDDVVSALLKGIDYLQDKKGSYIFHIGNNRSYSFNDVAAEINKYITLECKYIDNPIKENYVANTLAQKEDINITKRELNWEPKVSFEDGIKKCFYDYKIQYDQGLLDLSLYDVNFLNFWSI